MIPPEQTKKSLRELEAVVAQAVRPVPATDLPTWADEHRHLSSVSGAIGGPWRTRRVEVARGPMMAVTERGVKIITLKTCTQLMKSSLLENIIGRFAHLDPCPMLMVQPKGDLITAFSKERIVPMVKATPVLRKLFGEQKERRANDTIEYKEFPGGFVALGSAGSTSDLAMRPIRITLCDEIDKYEATKEGDPVLLAEERTSTFMERALKVRTCSPTKEGSSRIDNSYNASDMRKPFLRCPHCNDWVTLDFFKNVHWPRDDEGNHFPATAAVYCGRCGVEKREQDGKTMLRPVEGREWSEVQRLQMLTTKGGVRWFQTRPFKCCGVEQEPEENRLWSWSPKTQVGYACCAHCGEKAVSNEHAGFTASKLYDPRITIPELAKKWLESKDDEETKQTFYNTQLGLVFKGATLKNIQGHVLEARREPYEAEVPAGVVVLTAGVDVQSGSEGGAIGRLEVEVVGWGLGEESWHIAHEVIEGDPAQPEVWAKLDAFLLRQWKRETGHTMQVRATCIDSGGHNTEDVYRFARARVNRRVWAIKGASDRAGQWSPVWPIPKLEKGIKSREYGYRPIMLGVNAAKESVRQRLLIEVPGPGFCHYPADYPIGRFEQLTAEDLVVERRQGINAKKWVQRKGRANEALDCRVYAYSALCGLYANKFNMVQSAQLITQFEHLPAPEPVDPNAPAPRPAPVQKVRRSSFLS